MEIELINSEIKALIDEEDFNKIKFYKWRLHKGYVYSSGGKRPIAMHRLLMSAQKGTEVDHENGIRHDNRKSNLKIVTREKNNKNRSVNYKRKAHEKGRFLGVRKSASGKWQVIISYKGRDLYCGSFSDDIEAAKIYDDFARKLHGKNAVTNF